MIHPDTLSDPDDLWIDFLNDNQVNISPPIVTDYTKPSKRLTNTSFNSNSRKRESKHSKFVLGDDVAVDSQTRESKRLMDEIFYNDKGEPTDRFLEALKADLTKLPDLTDTDSDNVPQNLRAISKQKSKVVSASSNEDDLGKIRRHSNSVPLTGKNQDITDKHLTLSDAILKQINSTQRKKNSNTIINPEDKDVVEHCTVKVKSNSKKPTVHSHTIDKSSECIPKNKAKIDQPKAKSLDKPTDTKHYMTPLASTVTQSNVSLDDGETAENKLKSMKLRMKGQIMTIKKLQSQLQQANEILSLRDKQVEQFQNKLKAVSDAYSQSSLNQTKNVSHDQKIYDIIENYKVKYLVFFFVNGLLVC
jgi:hypothetical protein